MKSFLPNQCSRCGANLWMTTGSRNYVYYKGNYVCDECFSNKKKGRLMQNGRSD